MRVITILAGLCIGSVAQADAFNDHQRRVVACLAQMENGVTWGECLNVMFSPCAEDEVGSEAHVACLQGQRDIWRGTQSQLRNDLVQMLTAEGGTQMMNILHQWQGYVGDKCSQVGGQYAGSDTGAQAAQLGCEISELTGLTAELALCHDKASNAPFCTYEAD